MTSYQKEQSEALFMISRHFSTISTDEKENLKEKIKDYLFFRQKIDRFLKKNFSKLCTQKCYENKLSACCSREGIITFFADVVINALVSSQNDIQKLLTVLQKQNTGFKCIYLGKKGCLWRIKPIVCEMFLCDYAEKEVFGKDPEKRKIWEEFKEKKKLFTWPDRPVLFDDLEKYFIKKGYSSSLMYMHNSPGLLRIKKRSQQNSLALF